MPPVHLAVPEKPVGLALILGIFDRCGDCGSPFSATGSGDPQSCHRQREAGIPLAQGRSGRAGSLVEDGGRSFVLKNVSPSHGACGRRAATAPFRQGGHRVGFRPGAKHPEGLCPRGVAKPSPRTGEKSPRAACGRKSEGSFSAAVEKCKGRRKPAAFFGHRKVDRDRLRWMRSQRRGFWIQLCRVRWGEEPSPCPIGGARNHPLSHFCMLSSSRRGGVGMRSKTKAPSPCLN